MLMYAGIRRYQMAPKLSAVISRQLKEGLSPLLRELPGFVAYYVVDTGDGVLLTVRIFENQAGVEDFDKIAMGWATQNLEAFVSDIAESAPELLGSVPNLLVELEEEFLGTAYGEAKELSSREVRHQHPRGSREGAGGGPSEPSEPANAEEDLQLLSVDEVCKVLGMGKSWVYRMLRSGEVPSVKLGGSVKVMRTDLEEFLLNNRRYKPEDKE
jgi:excisionase family DNA binding protein